MYIYRVLFCLVVFFEVVVMMRLGESEMLCF